MGKYDRVDRPPYLQRAVIVVDGAEYYEWETVSVRCAIMEQPPRQARFTCSEQEPFGDSFAALRIRPGQSCSVYLDGELAITGMVATRQVFYDAHQHSVEIQVVGDVTKLTYSAAVTKTGEFKNIDVTSLAKALSSTYGVNVTTVGNVNQEKFPRAAVQPGEHVWDCVERFCRPAGAFMGSNAGGDLVLYGGAGQGGDEVIEGVNILEGREVIHSLSAGTGYSGASQTAGTDDAHGAQQNQVHNEQNASDVAGVGQQSGPRRMLSEVPTSLSMIKKRVGFENAVDQTLQISVTVTVLGWQRPSGGLWEPWQTVIVDSPMLIMNGQSLTLKAVTFTQDNNTGTRSTIELSNMVGDYAKE
jgi:prophage tail gpP-like protein